MPMACTLHTAIYGNGVPLVTMLTLLQRKPILPGRHERALRYKSSPFSASPLWPSGFSLQSLADLRAGRAPARRTSKHRISNIDSISGILFYPRIEILGYFTGILNISGLKSGALISTFHFSLPTFYFPLSTFYFSILHFICSKIIESLSRPNSSSGNSSEIKMCTKNTGLPSCSIHPINQPKSFPCHMPQPVLP